MGHFCWGAQIRLGTSDWSNIEKVRKKFIMKNFLTLLLHPGFLFSFKSAPYKGPIRIVLAAILAWEIDSPRALKREFCAPLIDNDAFR